MVPLTLDDKRIQIDGIRQSRSTSPRQKGSNDFRRHSVFGSRIQQPAKDIAVANLHPRNIKNIKDVELFGLDPDRLGQAVKRLTDLLYGRNVFDDRLIQCYSLFRQPMHHL